MKVRFLSCYLWLLFVPFFGFSQQDVLDSLKKDIQKKQLLDTSRVKALVAYVVEALNNNTADFLPYMNEVLSISKKINYRPGLQKGYMIGQIYFSDRGDYQKGFLYADSAFSVLKNDTTLNARQNTGHLYNNIAGDYYKIDDYEKAIENYTASARIFEPMDHPFLASIYGGLALVYEKLNESSKAIEYDQKAIAVAEKSGNARSLAIRLLNYAMKLINTKDYSGAATVLIKAKPFVMKLQNTSLLHQYYYDLGYIDEDNKDYTKAVSDYKIALAYAKQNEDPYQQTNVIDALSNCLIGMNKLQESKLYIDTLLQLSTKHDIKYARRNAYVNLAKWYAKKGDYKNANSYLQKKMNLADSIISEETKEKVANLEIRYRVEKKEQEINGLKDEKQIQTLTIHQKNILNYILIGSTLGMLLIAFLSYRSYRNKQKLQQVRISELETEKQLTATEAVLKGEEQERTRLAKDLHDGLGGMLSGIKHSFGNMKQNLIMTPENHQAFERSMDMLDSSIKEMRRVAHNMMPENLLKFGLDIALRDFCIDISANTPLRVNYQSMGLTDVQLDQTKSISIYRIVQELIHNTLKHASAQTALVQISKTDEQIAVEVEDDGVGININELKQAKGIGWSNIQSRVDFLQGKLDVQSEPGKGTSVHIEFKTA